MNGCRMPSGARARASQRRRALSLLCSSRAEWPGLAQRGRVGGREGDRPATRPRAVAGCHWLRAALLLGQAAPLQHSAPARSPPATWLLRKMRSKWSATPRKRKKRFQKMAFWGALPCFGIMFADVLETNPGNEGATIASIISLFSFCLPISGLLCPALYRRFSFRQVGVAGGLVYCAGSFSAAFAASALHLVLTYGAVQGAGFGLMLSASLASFNEHFRRRRTVAMAVAQCAIGAGSLALPLAAQRLQAAAGARAAKLGFAGLGAAAAACQLLLRPPPSPRPLHVHEECEESKKNGILAITHSSPDTTEGLSKWARWLRCAGLDAALLRDARVVGVAVGLCLAHVEELNFFAMFPLHARALGLEEAGVARAVATATAGDFAGRVALVAAGRWLARSNRLLFAAGAAASAAAVVGLVRDATQSFPACFRVMAALLALCVACFAVGWRAGRRVRPAPAPASAPADKYTPKPER
ncbi:Putative monocarboxylate transporter [Gryllus bimaculatus]|nr:Putative monocarboxylate transporter [Gryllus bimaculatus]